MIHCKAICFRVTLLEAVKKNRLATVKSGGRFFMLEGVVVVGWFKDGISDEI